MARPDYLSVTSAIIDELVDARAVSKDRAARAIIAMGIARLLNDAYDLGSKHARDATSSAQGKTGG